MRTSFKSIVMLLVMATAFTLASCQSELVEPGQKNHQSPQTSADDEDQPPKTGWPNSK